MFQDIRRSINNSDIGILIQEEKDVIKSCQKVAKEQAEASKYLAIYGKAEGSPDLIDITEKLWVVLDCITTAQSECGRKLELHREILKDIRTAEVSLATLKATEKNSQEKLKDAIKKQKNVAECQLQASECTALVLEKQSFVTCEKRRLLKQALNVKMDAIIEMSARMSIAATFGKHLADQIPQGQLSPGQALPAYTGRQTTQHILGDCLTALKDWQHPTKTISPEEHENRRMSVDSLSSDKNVSLKNLAIAQIRPVDEQKTRRLSQSVSLDSSRDSFVVTQESFTASPLKQRPVAPVRNELAALAPKEDFQEEDYSFYDQDQSFVSLPPRPLKPSKNAPKSEGDQDIADRINALRSDN